MQLFCVTAIPICASERQKERYSCTRHSQYDTRFDVFVWSLMQLQVTGGGTLTNDLKDNFRQNRQKNLLAKKTFCPGNISSKLISCLF